METTGRSARYQGFGRQRQKELLQAWWRRLEAAPETGQPVAYLFISGAVEEVLRAMGFEVAFPEVTALNCAIRQVSADYILRAEDLGYSQDVCGYVKNDIGLFLSGNRSPMGRLPRPTLLVCNYAGCRVYIKWFEALALGYQVPLYVLDVPYVRTETVLPTDVEYVVGQLQEFIEFCERLTGRAFDEDRFRTLLTYARQAEDLWVEVLEMARHVPAPFDAYFEAVYFMAPIYILRGLPETVDYYEGVRREIQERMELGLGPVPEERFRVVVEGPPPWPYLRDFWDMFKAWGAVPVASTYTKVGGLWDAAGVRHDPARPLESVAEYAMHCYVNWSLDHRRRLLLDYYRRFRADGFVIHSVKSCKSFAAGEADFREAFVKELDIPTLFIESDLVDPRYFQKAQLRNRIDAFFEALEHRRVVGVSTGGRVTSDE